MEENPCQSPKRDDLANRVPNRLPWFFVILVAVVTTFLVLTWIVWAVVGLPASLYGPPIYRDAIRSGQSGDLPARTQKQTP